MPRPGPRQYDCVRRGWHSERHQPIRGTLIQEIFRVVDEIHGFATKKNKQYREKLPIVVLKTEEILYSKANSEAEYMDLTTLLARTNDAIDTIIRRDENTETGQCLQPCIEAALNLGCPLSKTTRSQRNNPRCYLSQSKDEAPNATDRRHESKNVDHPANRKNEFLQLQPENLYSVYPLYYYGNNIKQLDESLHGSVSKTSFGQSIKGVPQNNLVCNLNPSNQGSQSCVISGDGEKLSTNKCDLSLRLGPIDMPVPQVQETEVSSKVKKVKIQG